MLALLPTMLLGEVVELTLEPMMQSIPILSPDTMGSSALSELLAEMKEQLSARPAPKPLVNPCAKDIERLHCSDAACLKRSAETLAPECAALLLSTPEPSPALAPRAVHFSMAPKTRPTPSGYFTMLSSSSDGEMRRISGPMELSSTRAVRIPAPNMAMMSGLGSMLSILPPELASMVQSTMEMEEQQEEEEEAEAAQHPCAREVNACVRETGCNSRSAIEGCLVKHFNELTTECKCFVHHITNGRTTAPTSAAVIKVTSAAEARPVAIGTVYSPHSVREVVVAEVPSHPAHRLSCLFVFTGLFLLAFLVVRAIITLLCCGRPARTVVIVPPEEARVKAVGAPPLLISEITTKPVQVAEPLAKA